MTETNITKSSYKALDGLFPCSFRIKASPPVTHETVIFLLTLFLVIFCIIIVMRFVIYHNQYVLTFLLRPILNDYTT